MAKYQAVYVLCPGGHKTGGTELLHQLVYNLNLLGVNSHIVYYGKDNGIHSAFKKYVSDYTYDISVIQDNEENLLVVPEIKIDFLNKFTNITKAVWWLSVDNYKKNASFSDRVKLRGFGSAVYGLIHGEIKDQKEAISKADIHFCQSYYSIDFIKESFGIDSDKIYYLSDYINDSYIENYKGVDKNNRKDLVLYNPKKGYKFTKELIKESGDLSWKPIENMTNEEVISLLSQSKCYIDFGNHPGKDRFPREAAICGCIVITGKRGAAAFKEDVCIPDEYKFDEKTVKKSEILDCIRDAEKNYNSRVDDFEEYRKIILNEKQLFLDNLKEYFVD